MTTPVAEKRIPCIALPTLLLALLLVACQSAGGPAHEIGTDGGTGAQKAAPQAPASISAVFAQVGGAVVGQNIACGAPRNQIDALAQYYAVVIATNAKDTADLDAAIVAFEASTRAQIAKHDAQPIDCEKFFRAADVVRRAVPELTKPDPAGPATP